MSDARIAVDAARRVPENPLLTPESVPPSRPDFKVVGAFNPAVIQTDETLLLLRVAEAPSDVPSDEVAAPVFDAASGRVEVRRWRRDTPGIRLDDPRVIVVDGRSYLTSISHLRLARSKDGVRFQVDPAPALRAEDELESFGIEDARATMIDGTCWVNYTAVSPWGISTALASTRDFRAFRRKGIIFPPNNRDVAIFPDKVEGRYLALHRPMPEGIGRTGIWLASSEDLVSWGGHRPVAGPRDGFWDDLKVGGGAVPFRVRVGGRDAWLAIYHGVTASPLTYSLGALLLDGRDPSRVLGRSREPILAPKEPYERRGFFGDVVFTCGLAVLGGKVRVYYGAADGVTAMAELSLDRILGGLS